MPSRHRECSEGARRSRALDCFVATLLAMMFISVSPLFAFDTQKISINTATEKISLTVEMAVTPSQRELGLMYRKEMPADHGMLFVFDSVGPHSFWMKNTVLSLDILFLDSHKKIVFIAENAKPFSEDLISPPMSTAYALEVNAGFAKAHSIAVGQKIDFY